MPPDEKLAEYIADEASGMAQFYHQSIIPNGVQNENGQDVLRFDVNNAIQRTQNAPEKGYGISS